MAASSSSSSSNLSLSSIVILIHNGNVYIDPLSLPEDLQSIQALLRERQEAVIRALQDWKGARAIQEETGNRFRVAAIIRSKGRYYKLFETDEIAQRCFLFGLPNSEQSESKASKRSRPS